ncbi:50S ribosomal protein L9 [Candidatus Aquicultor secundus]|nr:50S ribosomal protein L9 [Candidatus Aquicultor secundus]
MMKVILKESVSGLGKTGDVIDVADGYARNYLVPKNIAVVATKGTLKEWDLRRATLVKKEAKDRTEAEAIAAGLNNKEVKVEAKAGEEGKLYGSVTSKEIAAAIEKQLKTEVDKKKIELAQPIKEVGDHPVTVKLFPGVDTTVIVKVVGSKEE